jgi:hypothetical protein
MAKFFFKNPSFDCIVTLAEVGWLNDDIQAIASQDFMESTDE